MDINIKYQQKIDEIENITRTHVSKINYKRAYYDIKVGTSKDNRKSIIILYKGKEFLTIEISLEKTKTLKFSLTNDGAPWFLTTLRHSSITLSLEDPIKEIKKEIKKNLPLSDTRKISKIQKELDDNHIDYENVFFDSYRGKYVITGQLHAFESLKTPHQINEDCLYYKYMSLEAYLCMLEKGTYRMNSIVSMNDTSESFLLNNFVCQHKLSEEDRYKAVIENKNILISSFCSDFDNPEMWRLYGDNGKGVCIVFRITNPNLQPIVYVGEDDRDKFFAHKNVIAELRKQKIDAYFEDIENKKCFVKSNQFKYENEVRITLHCDDNDVKMTHYGNLISVYKDFSIKGDEFNRLGVTAQQLVIGANLPNSDVNYPLLISKSKEVLGIEKFSKSKVDKIRI